MGSKLSREERTTLPTLALLLRHNDVWAERRFECITQLLRYPEHTLDDLLRTYVQFQLLYPARLIPLHHAYAHPFSRSPLEESLRSPRASAASATPSFGPSFNHDSPSLSSLSSSSSFSPSFAPALPPTADDLARLSELPLRPPAAASAAAFARVRGPHKPSSSFLPALAFSSGPRGSLDDDDSACAAADAAALARRLPETPGEAAAYLFTPSAPASPSSSSAAAVVAAAADADGADASLEPGALAAAAAAAERARKVLEAIARGEQKGVIDRQHHPQETSEAYKYVHQHYYLSPSHLFYCGTHTAY